MKPIVATYRLQLNRHFTFQDVMARLDYLQALNISHLYLSPVMESVPGSDHGYDVTDFAAVSRERGGEEGLRALDRRLREMSPRMHMILDVVPNHMAACLDNRYWRDVLARGINSPWWHYFDLRVGSHGKIEIPMLWDQQSALITGGGIGLALEDADVVIRCGESLYPVSAATEAMLRARFRGSREKSFAEYLDSLPPVAVGDILNAQHYAFVLASQASHTSSYRRFFDINGLVALRQEDPDVFQDTHRKLFELARELPSVAGVRVDHVDGLARPKEYLRRLAAEIPNIWIEKILARHEELRSWPCLGTTGYEFIDRLNMVTTDARGFRRMEAFWKKGRPKWKDFASCVRRSKLDVLETLFPAEVDRLSAMLGGRRYDAAKMKSVVMALTAALPVYRVYGATSPADRKWLEKALSAFRRPSAESRAVATAVTEPSGSAQKNFFADWQRLSGPAMAKGLEDRAHYRYAPLAALNEVGCTPIIGDNGRKDFCKWLRKRQETWPFALNAATTHDTKRSEDARSRLQALADLPDIWESYVRRASQRLKNNSRIRPPTVSFFLQAVLGTWPLSDAPDDAYQERLWRYMLKAARETAMDTFWSWPDHTYEAALEDFVHGSLSNPLFQRSTAAAMSFIAPAAAVNSLAALAIRGLSAGVPDIYQGTELWNFTLVDPDNRSLVDFDLLERSMRRCDSEATRRETLAMLTDDWRHGGIKMWLTRELLKIRRGFLRAAGTDYDISYVNVSGDLGDCVFAWQLLCPTRRLIVAAARHPGRLVRQGHGIDVGGAGWGNTTLHLPAQHAADLLSGANFSNEDVSAGALFRHLPVAVLSL